MDTFLNKIKKFYFTNRFWLLLVIFPLLLLLVSLILLLTVDSIRELLTNPDSIRAFILSYENWAILTYVVLSIVVVVVPPLPNEIVPIVGGIVFGFWTALIFGLIARITGSSINYWLGTKIRKGFYLKFINEEEKEKIKKYTDKMGWLTVFISRFIPSTDTDLIAYVSGIVQMKYSTFILASFFGMLAPVSFTIFVGSSLFVNKYLFFTLVTFYIILMLFAPVLIKKFLLKEK